MLETITLQEAQTHLADLIAKLDPGEEVIITHDDRPVATLTGKGTPAHRTPRNPGSARGKLAILAEDDEHLADFQEYLP